MRKLIAGVLLVAMPCVALAADPAGSSKKETEAKFNQLFKAVDTNGDGKISKQEAELKAPAMAEGFDVIDTDHDGGLSKAEIKAFTGALEKKRHDFQQRLEKADKDKNGLLSREEASALPNLSAHFEEIDSNFDGQLTIKEISDYLRSLTAAAPPAAAKAPSASAVPTAPVK
jgi:Ca2+-binding EF-hand superfamily protein